MENFHSSYCLIVGSFVLIALDVEGCFSSGRGGSVDADTVAVDYVELHKNPAEYDPSCIFRGNETGLLYTVLPERKYIVEARIVNP